MAAGRYWRLNISANSGDSSSLSIAEIQLRASIGGTDQCTGGTASAYSESSALFAASKAVDDTATTFWQSASGDRLGWWQYVFPSPVAVVEYTIQSPTTPGRSPSAWDLIYSDDGVNWHTAESRDGQTGWSSGEVRTFAVSAVSATPVLAQEAVEVLMVPDPDLLLAQVAVEALIQQHVDGQLAQVAVEVMTREGPSGPTPIAGEIASSLMGAAALTLGLRLSGTTEAAFDGAAALGHGSTLHAAGLIEATPRARLASAAAPAANTGNFFLLF